MSALMFRLKCVLNILATLALIVGGILIILLAWILPSSAPFAVLGHVKALEFILAGSTLIVLSLSPLVVAINVINLHQGYNRCWQRQTIRELDGIVKDSNKSGNPSPSHAYIEDEIPDERTETVKYCQSEKLVQMVQDPMALWNGEDVHSLIDLLEINKQGHLKYPSTHPFSDQVTSTETGLPVTLNNDQALFVGNMLSFDPETVHFKRTESFIEVVNNPGIFSNQITAASITKLLHLDQLGTLHFSSFPVQSKC